ALPALLKVPENRPKKNDDDNANAGFVESYRILWADLKALWRRDRRTVKFLVASAIFRDRLAGVFTFGAILAVTVYGLSAGDVLLFGVAANVISAFGALLGGFLDDRIGPKPIIIVSLLIMVVDVAILYFVDGPQNFWIFGLILCAFVGPAQSASRSFLTRLSPDNQEGQLFGLYATTGRAVSWMAPTLFGLFVAITGEDRAGIWGIGLLPLVGAGLLTMAKAPGTTASLQPGSLADSPRE